MMIRMRVILVKICYCTRDLLAQWDTVLAEEEDENEGHNDEDILLEDDGDEANINEGMILG